MPSAAMHVINISNIVEQIVNFAFLHLHMFSDYCARAVNLCCFSTLYDTHALTWIELDSNEGLL